MPGHTPKEKAKKGRKGTRSPKSTHVTRTRPKARRTRKR